MGFNINKFETSTFNERTFNVDVPELIDFFDKDDKLEWVVRGLNAEELAIVNDAVDTNNNIGDILSAITSQDGSNKMDAIKDLIGLSSDNVPSDIVRRFAMLTKGSVNPECPQSIAVKLGQSHPTVLYKLTNKIIELTGLGQKLGE